MKPIVSKSYPYSADYYGYRLITSADGTVTTREYDVVPAIVKLSLSVNLLGDLVIESASKMQINSYLENITDRNGTQVYQNGVWEIYQTAPLLSGIGTVEGFRYRARIIAGDI